LSNLVQTYQGVFMLTCTHNPDLLTRQEAAAYLRVSKSWLAAAAAAGTGPVMVRLGGKVFYSKSGCDDYIKERTLCHSTSKKPLNSGGVSSGPTGSSRASAREKQIAATLRKKNVACAQKQKVDQAA
jgi:hypothetical protein